MYITFWIVLSGIFWFGVEFGCRNRGIRVTVQILLVIGFCMLAFAGGQFMGSLNGNIQSNNILKNLTRGLVAITSEDEHDPALMVERLEVLNEKVIPTYETTSSSREAVEGFLKTYDIEYEAEIPVGDSQQ